VPEDYPRKYWWVVLVVVPIAAVLIPLLFDTFKDQGKKGVATS
jgi:hypothetical protein